MTLHPLLELDNQENLPVPTKVRLNDQERKQLLWEMECWYKKGAAILAVRRNKEPCHFKWKNRFDVLIMKKRQALR